ncbi:SusF/SusE family outer membrane protein [Gillisia hiemivivida]|uniref:SusF/SusE family outer membrane protein n=1 Tax=Gillisia hiemivivida TaxID=291190 RepID=A0A5C6ZV62_9FLAO|nr:SusF/SusE family outer membrane protein [Gillisia hiemivivida]TXD94531.1 SusF/SusE family outer membrane protein [Gillisia hiemivivida]
MKKLLMLLFAVVALVGLNSCSSDDDVVFIAQPDPEGINFMNSFNDTYVLTPATSGNVAERFVWNTVNLDVPTNITYELQASTDGDFTSFDVIGSTGENNLAVKVSQLITLATDAGLDADAETDSPNTGPVYFRIKAYAGNDGGNALNTTSEIKSITVLMPEAAVEEEVIPAFKQLYLVGDATAAGWNPDNNNTPLFRDSENPNIFYFTGIFNAGSFKIVGGQAWAPSYGKDGNSLQFRETEDDPDPANFDVATAGYYSLTVNIDDLTYTFEPYDASGATAYTVIGIVGDGTTVGWPGDDNPTPDIQMTPSSINPHIWNAQNVELNGANAKFRANLAWDAAWAGPFPAGQGVSDGDIPTVEGTYNVWFNDITKRYVFIPIVVTE